FKDLKGDVMIPLLREVDSAKKKKKEQQQLHAASPRNTTKEVPIEEELMKMQLGSTLPGTKKAELIAADVKKKEKEEQEEEEEDDDEKELESSGSDDEINKKKTKKKKKGKKKGKKEEEAEEKKKETTKKTATTKGIVKGTKISIKREIRLNSGSLLEQHLFRMNPIDIGQQFAQHYYASLDGNRDQLAPFYIETEQAKSQMTMEGDVYIGPKALEKWKSLPQLQHQVKYCDVQGGPGGSIFVFILGQIILAGQSQPVQFAESFFLMPNGTSYYISNQVFRFAIAL
ncbi:MAG: hypothetical protein EZS28_017967, partial [Streblomastix strix]